MIAWINTYILVVNVLNQRFLWIYLFILLQIEMTLRKKIRYSRNICKKEQIEAHFHTASFQ